jgi:HAD superfamily hydrolase (TIGR01450 family)
LEYAKYSIGNILLYECIKYLYYIGFVEFNFMRGQEYYKEKWAKLNRKSYSISLKKKQLPLLFLRRKREEYLKQIKGLVFDLDGVVYKNNLPIIDTIDGINLLDEIGYKIGFLTNTSSKKEDEINAKLIEFGIKRSMNIIMTSSIATSDYLIQENINTCFLFGGGEALRELLETKNIKIVNETSIMPDCVLIGYSKDFNYDILNKVISYLNIGAKLICTDKDYTFSHNDRNLPATGWYVESIEKVSGKKGIVIGKPSTFSLLKILTKMELKPYQVLLIGDNLNTDIMAAKNLNMPSCLLLGGVSTIKDVASCPFDYKPEFIINSLKEIINHLTY